MNNPTKVVMNWSSGKDASLAYYLLSQQSEYEVTHLLTTMSEEHARIFMHGVREDLLEAQALRMKLPLIKVKLPASPNDDLYKNAMQKTLAGLSAAGVSAAAFGDIFLEDLRTYREQQLAQVGVKGLFPLWKRDTRELVRLVEKTRIEAIIVCVNERHLGKEFLGRKINTDLLNDLPEGVDPCGENGEFHTFVHDAPFFSAPIPVVLGEIVHRKYTSPDGDNRWDTGFYFLDIHA